MKVMEIIILSIVFTPAKALFDIGVGIADVTGPSAEVPFMGYANLDQKGRGIHLRQFSRAFVIGDGHVRLVFASVDVGMIGHGVREGVIQNLMRHYGDTYNEQNVIISGIHTHSGPGGFLQHMLFDISVLGFHKQTFDALIGGITRSIIRAHKNIVPGRIFFNQGDLLNVSINRSPKSYEANPEDERSKFAYNTDKQMMQLRMMSEEGSRPLGIINWFAVHPTSMNNTNKLISSDNMGYASLLFEEEMNPGKLPGKGDFVAAFASSNLGDVSPNILGPRCIDTGEECDELRSTCHGETGLCVARGPGRDMYESTSIIAGRLRDKSRELFEDQSATEIVGALKVIHQFVDMPNQEVIYYNRRSRSNIKAHGCLPAMGYSFGAGTTDGPGARAFGQGSTMDNPLWNRVRNLIHEPSSEQVECHGAKPILVPTGELNFPYEWQPSIVSTQLAILGSSPSVVVAAVPGEFTTMAGRRIRDAISEEIEAVVGPSGRPLAVAIAGLSNTYSDYVTTPEEYTVQRYEGASTIYGPHTLTLYLHQYAKLARVLVEGKTLDPGPQPPSIDPSTLISFITPVIFDSTRWGTKYGEVLEQPPAVAYPGEVVRVKFVSGHPRNNLRQEDTFLSVEKQRDNGEWDIVYTDASWSTKFIWMRTSFLLGCSEATVEWAVAERDAPGHYRIRHFGNYKYILGGIYGYEGVSNTFQVLNSHRKIDDSPLRR
ncbi:neutral ceramidase [Hetaerina americana]|uniref:neutral ceramidase n=1 Tax=Hetaerina americana TaxID=62018 RepID=UPI003A7F12BD